VVAEKVDFLVLVISTLGFVEMSVAIFVSKLESMWCPSANYLPRAATSTARNDFWFGLKLLFRYTGVSVLGVSHPHLTGRQ